MGILDRYVLRQFVQVFVICFCSLNGLYVVFDGLGNLDDFMDYAEGNGPLLPIMASFYGYQSIYFFEQLSGVLTMMSAMFTMTWLQRYQELTAIQAAGISKWRVVAPILCAGAVISLSMAVARETLIPSIRDELSRTPSNLGGTVAQEVVPRYDHKTDILFRGRATVASERRVKDPRFRLPVGLDRYGPELIAENAYYKSASEEHPAGYLLTQVTEPTDLAHKESIRLNDAPVIITPRDAPWLKPDECFVVSEVNFEQLTGGQSWRKFSSTAELIRGLHNPSLDFGADVRVAVHSRFVQPMLDFVLIFLGLPLILGRSNRNIFVAVGMCVLLVGLFMLVVIGSRTLATSYLINPALGTWLPLMVFVPVGVWLSERISQ